jgi:CPA2 family monovalent cation:H+ antiporter-2
MIHLPELIQDLGLILIAAAVVSLLFKSLNQPVVLGYLVAGFLVGPQISLTPTVIEAENLKIWGEIGVIFLLFGLGLEFSFKKLAQVGVQSSITALFEIAFMVGAGFLSGRLLGWSTMDSLFLGGLLSISSTTIIVRALEEVGLKSRRFVNVVFGVLIIEDLVAVLLLVVLSTVAVTQSFAGRELLMSALKLMFFVLIWFVMGLYSLPLFLRKIRDYLDSEMTLIMALGLCLLMVMIATQTGFSAPLGAFVMGSLLAETRQGKNIEHLIGPVKNLFSAIFFVTVGMMFDPQIIRDHAGTVIFLTLVTIFGKFLSTSLGALMAGQSLRHSIQSGLSLAQIGEFSFIIATLGTTLQVTNEILYPLAVVISGITTFTTPYLMRLADPLSAWLEKALPETILRRLDSYRALVFQSESSPRESQWTAGMMPILLNTVLVLAVHFSVRTYLQPMLVAQMGSSAGLSIALCLFVILLASPFLWALTLADIANQKIQGLKSIEMSLAVLRTLLGLGLVGFIIHQLTSNLKLSPTVLFFLYFFSLYGLRFAGPLYRRLETIFKSNLEEGKELATHPQRALLAPWDAGLAEFVVSPDSSLVAKTLKESALRENLGVTIALIQRGQKRILAPQRDEFLFPYDRVFLIGTDEQLARAQKQIEFEIEKRVDEDLQIYGLESLVLPETSEMVGRSIRDSGLREQVKGLIVGLERGGERILNPDSSLILKPGDLLWIVGERQRILTLKTF